jgi:hypothetical protein
MPRITITISAANQKAANDYMKTIWLGSGDVFTTPLLAADGKTVLGYWMSVACSDQTDADALTKHFGTPKTDAQVKTALDANKDGTKVAATITTTVYKNVTATQVKIASQINDKAVLVAVVPKDEEPIDPKDPGTVDPKTGDSIPKDVTK